jgi:tetratricopeptide (TPR) repeat protein
VLASLPAEELGDELDRVALPSAAEEQAEPGRLQTARDAYCETIFTGRLYGRLPAEAQRMLSQAAVYGLAVTLEGLAAVAGTPVAALREAAEQWRALALVHVDPGGGRELWSVYGMLRGWLLARLDGDGQRAAHVAAGDFLVEQNQQDREGELGVSWVVCLLEARAQYLAAGALDQARAVTGQISGFYVRQGLYAEIERLNQDLLELEEHPDALGWLGRAHLDRAQYGEARTYYQRALELAGKANPAAAGTALHGLATIDLREGAYPAAREKFERSLTMRQQISDRAGEAATWHQLATIDLNEGAYPAAREKFARSLTIKQQIGDRAGEAATWHQLATIDLNEGAYPAVREKFEQALAMRQQIGDRAGEAATWFQLGQLATRLGKAAEGLAMIGLCYLIDREIGHADTQSDLRAVEQAAADLNYAPDQVTAVLQSAVESYARDRGAELLRNAFR